jgi:ABC-type phosphate transport system substrate-binding protein
MTLMRSILFLSVCALVISMLTGCASVAGYAGTHPATISCKGKGAISGQGSATVAGGNFSIQADCGDGFEYRQTGDKQ